MKYVLFRIRTGIPLLSDDGGLVMERVYRDYVSDEATDLVLASEGWERDGRAEAVFEGLAGLCSVFGIRRTAEPAAKEGE